MEAANSGEDCPVKVAVHVRPLIGDEKLQGCQDCVTVVPRKPQYEGCCRHGFRNVKRCLLDEFSSSKGARIQKPLKATSSKHPCKLGALCAKLSCH